MGISCIMQASISINHGHLFLFYKNKTMQSGSIMWRNYTCARTLSPGSNPNPWIHDSQNPPPQVCDLHGFLKSSSMANDYKLDLLANFRIWRALVGRVESLHERGLIHRDLKPTNFILVPKTYSDVRVLSQTPTPRAQFVYRLVDNHNDKRSQSNAQESSSSSQCYMLEDVGVGSTSVEPLLAQKKSCVEASASSARACEPVRRDAADLEVLVQHPTSKQTVAIPLIIKVSDFGTGQRLNNVEHCEQDDGPGQHATHLSVFGLVGTAVYMPPEVVRQTPDRRKRVCKRSDVWALGIMVFQMLHEGKTPFHLFQRVPGGKEAILAVASETVNNDVIPKQSAEGREKLWEVERRRMLAGPLRRLSLQPSGDVEVGEVLRSLVEAWVRMEVLFILGERCLAFSVDDRMDCADLSKLLDRAAEALIVRRRQGGIDSPTGNDARLAGGAQAHAHLAGDARPRTESGTVPDSELSQLVAILEGIMGRGGQGGGTEEAGKEGMIITGAGWEGNAGPGQEGSAGREGDAGQEGSTGREGSAGREGTTDTTETKFSELDMEVARIGDKIGAQLFPEVWVTRPSAKERAHLEGRALALLGSSSGSCSCSIFGIIGIAISVLAAVGLVLHFVMPGRSSSSPGYFVESASGSSGVVDITGGSKPSVRYPSTSTGGPSSDDDAGAAGPISPPNFLGVGPTSGTSRPETPPVAVFPFVETTMPVAEEPASSIGQGGGGLPAVPRPTVPPPKGGSSDNAAAAGGAGGVGAKTGTDGGVGAPMEKKLCATAAWHDDRDFVLEEIGKKPLVLEYLPDKWKSDKEIVLKAVGQRGAALQFASAGLRADTDVIREALEQDSVALKFVDSALDSYRDIVLEVVKKHDDAFQYAETLWADREVAFAAVKRNPRALKYVGAAVEGSYRDFVLEVVKEYWPALTYASNELLADRAFVLEAVKQNSSAMVSAPRELRISKEFVLDAVRQDSQAWKHVSAELLISKEFLLEAVRQDSEAWKYIPHRWLDSKEFVLEAVRQDSEAWKYASSHLPKDFRRKVEALREVAPFV